MRVLALETSAKACSAAVTEDGRVVASAFQCTGLTHSRTLMPMVEAMLKNAELIVADCDAIAVANGPGSFTGIRIGVAAAKGLAFAAEKPVVGISTLEAMARNAIFWDGLVVCAMDARRQQVYNAVFQAENSRLTRLTPDRPIALADLARELAESPRRKIVLGDGGLLCYHDLTEQGVSCTLAPPHLLQQNAVSVALAAEEVLQSGGGQTAQALVPVYLRPPQAERLRDRQSKHS